MSALRKVRLIRSKRLIQTTTTTTTKGHDNLLYIKAESILRLNRVLNKLKKNVWHDDWL